MLANFLSRGYFIFLWALFLIVAGFLFYCRSCFAYFKKLPKKGAALLSLLFLIALVLRIGVIPHMHHVYYDEFHFMHIAQNMHYHGVSGYTLKGDKAHPEVMSATDHRPGGYPFLLSLAFLLCGDSERAVFYFNSLLGALSVALVFLIAYLLFHSIGVSFWSAFVFNILPLHLKYSGTGASDIASLFFMLLAIFIAALYYAHPQESLLYLLSSIVVFASYLRPENIILFFLTLLLLWMEYRKSRLRPKGFLDVLYVPLVLLLPLFIHIPHIIRTEIMFLYSPLWSLQYFFNNLPDNVKYIFSAHYNVALAGIFFLVGTGVLYIKERKLFYLLIGWFLLFFLLYTGYKVGNFSPQVTCDAERHFLPASVSFAILSGYGIYAWLDLLKTRRIVSIICGVLIVALFSVNSFFAARRSIDVTMRRDVYKEYVFLKEYASTLPQDIYMLDYHPDYFISVFNKKAIALDIFQEDRNYPKQLILFKGRTWYANSALSAEYESFLKNIYDFKVLIEKDIHSRLRCSFVRLTLKAR